MKISRHARPRNSGLAREPHRRSGSDVGRRRLRARRPCRRGRPRANARRSNCATATSARYGGKGVRKAVANINGEIAASPGRQGARPARARRAMIALDGTPTKSRLGANALLGRVDGGAARGGGIEKGARSTGTFPRSTASGGALSLPVPMMNILNGGRPRRFERGLPGVHGHAGHRRVVLRGGANRRRDLSRAARHPEGPRSIDRRRRRRRLRPQPEVQSGSTRGRAGSHRQDRQARRSGRVHRARRRLERALGRRRPLHVQEVRRSRIAPRSR